MLVSILLCISLLCLLFKQSFLVILILLEVSLLCLIFIFANLRVQMWFALLILCLGACESSCGLSVAVALARKNDVAAFGI